MVGVFSPPTGPILFPESHGPWAPEPSSRQAQGGRRTAHHRGSPGYREVILFLFILGKNSEYKIILVKVKIHHLDFEQCYLQYNF